MSTLRNLRSITSHLNLFEPSSKQQQITDESGTGTVKRHRLKQATQKHPPRSESLESHNINDNLQLRHQHSAGPLTELRRRLARKASTFSLRTRHRQAERVQDDLAREEEKLKELVLLGSEKGSVESVQHTPRPVPQVLVRASPVSQEKELPECETRSVRKESSGSTIRAWHPTATSSTHVLLSSGTAASSEAASNQELIRQAQELCVAQQIAGGITSVVKMASEQVQPPVPYTRLKEITEHACDAALSEASSYSHSDTEKWNTTIINSILGALVEETTVQSNGESKTPGQPQFKYVVNSTIIQHAAASSSSVGDEPKKTSGRRGMHAASGAYWNNEKDGMWSFKYPGADSKGLDVVVGIIWVWVG